MTWKMIGTSGKRFEAEAGTAFSRIHPKLLDTLAGEERSTKEATLKAAKVTTQSVGTPVQS
jgi:hypothetical protein